MAGGTTLTLPSTTGTVLAAGNALINPQGRLTLVTATPVMTSAQTGKTTLYYTPYVGSTVPIYDGTNWSHARFSELSNITTNSSTGSAGPAAVTTNSNYDLFVWSNSGTLTLTRGPAWTSDTARGTGAGTTQISMQNGIWVNTVAITNGPGANLGTYVGTVRSDGSSQLNWNPAPAAASGGAEAKLHVYNAYNKVFFSGQSIDNNSWSYGTTTWRSADNSNTNRVSYIDGLGDISVDTILSNQNATTNTANPYYVGCNRDSTSAQPNRYLYTVFQNTTTAGTVTVPDTFSPSTGFHYLQAMEYAAGSGVTTFSLALRASLTL